MERSPNPYHVPVAAEDIVELERELSRSAERCLCGARRDLENANPYLTVTFSWDDTDRLRFMLSAYRLLELSSETRDGVMMPHVELATIEQLVRLNDRSDDRVVDWFETLRDEDPEFVQWVQRLPGEYQVTALLMGKAIYDQREIDGLEDLYELSPDLVPDEVSRKSGRRSSVSRTD